MAALTDILSSGWGPSEDAIPSFSGLPFAPFSKHDRISYVANWDPSTYRGRSRRSRGPQTYGADENAGFGVMSDDEEEKEKFDDMITVKKRSYETIAKYRRDRTKATEALQFSQGRKVIAEQQRLQNAPTSRRATRRQVQNKRRRKKYIENPRPTRASVVKVDAWIDLTDIWFRENFDEGYGNTKTFTFKIDGEDMVNRVYTPQPQVLREAGIINGVLTRYDMSSSNTYKPSVLDYQKYSDYKYCNMNWKSAIEDPYILELANAGTGKANIFTTENVLSAIMCCNRSRYSFDIVINKMGDKIFLDERAKVLSMDHVDETSANRPTRKSQQKSINGYESLAREATYVNNVFREQMLYHSNLKCTHKLKMPNPFAGAFKSKGKSKGKKQAAASAGQQLASQGFTYNLYNVTDTMRVICRSAIDGYVVKKNPKAPKEYVRIFALNQYACGLSKTAPYDKCLATKDSSILAKEITNNNFKCARWGLKAQLSGAKWIKMGYVMREKSHSTDKHLICGVKTYDTKDFIRNCLFIRRLEQPWTVFAKFMKLVRELKEDGRYVAVRDPLKQVIRMYRVEQDSFKKDDNMPTYNAIEKLLGRKKKKDDDDDE